MAKPLINGFEYSFADIQVKIGAAEIYGITELNYDIEQAKENIYGAGENPVSRGRGTKQFTASMTLLGSEIEILRRLGSGDLTNLAAFDLQVSYTPPDVTKLTTHILQNCEFTQSPAGGATGDTSLPQTINFVWAGFTQF